MSFSNERKEKKLVIKSFFACFSQKRTCVMFIQSQQSHFLHFLNRDGEGEKCFITSFFYYFSMLKGPLYKDEMCTGKKFKKYKSWNPNAQ